MDDPIPPAQVALMCEAIEDAENSKMKPEVIEDNDGPPLPAGVAQDEEMGDAKIGAKASQDDPLALSEGNLLYDASDVHTSSTSQSMVPASVQTTEQTQTPFFPFTMTSRCTY